MDRSQRFRGMFGMAITWGVALATLATGSLALGLATGLVPSSIYGARELVALTVRGLLFGGLAGGLFAWLLSRREGGRTLETLSTRRVAAWGFIAAGSLPTIMALAATGPALPLGLLVVGTAGFGAIGSLLSTATLRIARRADAQLAGIDEDRRHLSP